MIEWKHLIGLETAIRKWVKVDNLQKQNKTTNNGKNSNNYIAHHKEDLVTIITYLCSLASETQAKWTELVFSQTGKKKTQKNPTMTRMKIVIYYVNDEKSNTKSVILKF